MTPNGNTHLVNDRRGAIHYGMARRGADLARHNDGWGHQNGEQKPEGNSSFHGIMIPHPKGETQ